MQTIPASNQGFTLVELCVVLAVMAILATFAAPSFVAWQTRDQVDARARALFHAVACARRSRAARCTRHALQDRCVSSLPRIGPKLRKRCHRLVVRMGLVRRARRCFDAFAHAAGDDIGFHRRDIDRAFVHAAFGAGDRRIPQLRIRSARRRFRRESVVTSMHTARGRRPGAHDLRRLRSIGMKDVQRGDSLIEVMIALTLMAVTARGLIATQSALARGVAARTGRADRRFRRGRHSQRCGPCGDRVAMAGESGVDAACGRRGNIRSRRWRAHRDRELARARPLRAVPRTAG